MPVHDQITIQPMDTCPTDGHGHTYAVVRVPMKWVPYKPKSQEVLKYGKKGRWQVWNGHGFANLSAGVNISEEDIAGWTDQPPSAQETES